MQRFYTRPHVPVDIIRVSKPTKSSEKDHSFYNTVSLKKTSLILRTSTHLTLKIICFRNIVKNLSDFKSIPANMFLFGVRKNVWAASFLDAKELYSVSTLKGNICVFLYISVRKFLFQRGSKVLSDRGWVGDWGG